MKTYGVTINQQTYSLVMESYSQMKNSEKCKSIYEEFDRSGINSIEKETSKMLSNLLRSVKDKDEETKMLQYVKEQIKHKRFQFTASHDQK